MALRAEHVRTERSRSRRRTGRIVRRVLLVAVVAGWWFTLAPRMIGGPTTWTVVSGTSMLPRYHTGDLVVARRQPSYHLGETVIASVDGGHIVHQLHSGSARTGWHTKGINKNTPDLWTIPNRDVLGEAWFMIPGAGTDLRWLGTATGRILVAALLAVFVAAWPRKRRPARAAAEAEPRRGVALDVLLVTTSVGAVAAVAAWMASGAAGQASATVLGVPTLVLGIVALTLLSPSLPLLAYVGLKEMARTRAAHTSPRHLRRGAGEPAEAPQVI